MKRETAFQPREGKKTGRAAAAGALRALLFKMDLCKKLQSYLNTIFLGMASLLTASLLLSCSLRAVFFRESDLTVNLRKINFPNI